MDVAKVQSVGRIVWAGLWISALGVTPAYAQGEIALIGMFGQMRAAPWRLAKGMGRCHVAGS